jgi:hypothetical protein
MGIERKIKKGVQIKSSWVTIFILLATLVLVGIQAWNIFYGQEPEEYNLAQASEVQDLASQNQSQEGLSEEELAKQNYEFTLDSVTSVDSVIQVEFDYKDYDPSEGKVYPAFYFDEFVDVDSSYIYYGQSPVELPSNISPIEAKKVCASLVSANLQLLEDTEKCLEINDQEEVLE